MFSKLVDAIVLIPQNGFTWQETIVTGLALAALVLMTLIITNGIVKILTTFFTTTHSIICKVGHSFKQAFTPKIID